MFATEVWAATHRGHRKEVNEDGIQVFGFLSQAADSGVVTFRGSTSEVGPVVTVADGVSRSGSGRIASRLALESLASDIHLLLEDEEAAFRAADLVLRDAMERDEGLAGMATTLCTLIAGHDQFAVVSVGDSECLRWQQDGYLARLSALDAVPKELGERSNVLTQVVGGAADRAALPLKPDIHRAELRHGDVFLICTDGLTDLVPAGRLEQRLQSGQLPMDITKGLLEDALNAGGKDNISLALVRFRDPTRRKLKQSPANAIGEETPDLQPSKLGRSWNLKKAVTRARKD